MKNTYLKETLQRIRPVQYSFDLNIFYFTKCFAQMCLQGVPQAWTLQDGSNHGAGLVLSFTGLLCKSRLQDIRVLCNRVLNWLFSFRGPGDCQDGCKQQ